MTLPSTRPSASRRKIPAPERSPDVAGARVLLRPARAADATVEDVRAAAVAAAAAAGVAAVRVATTAVAVSAVVRPGASPTVPVDTPAACRSAVAPSSPRAVPVERAPGTHPRASESRGARHGAARGTGPPDDRAAREGSTGSDEVTPCGVTSRVFRRVRSTDRDARCLGARTRPWNPEKPTPHRSEGGRSRRSRWRRSMPRWSARCASAPAHR